MADGVILSQDTFDRIMRVVEDYENSFRDGIQLGDGLIREEEGDGYVKIGIDGVECPTT